MIGPFVWCWDNSQAGGSDLLILLALADQYQGAGTFLPKLSSLAERGRVSKYEALDAIYRLIQLGEVEIDTNSLTFHLPAVEHAREIEIAEYEAKMDAQRASEAARQLAYSDQQWDGRWPIPPGHPHPRKGQPVVYFLYENRRKLCYIGSTQHFLDRMNAHQKDKSWNYWRASLCSSRKDAYRLEAKEIEDLKPPLNKIRRVKSVADRIQAELKRREVVA